MAINVSQRAKQRNREFLGKFHLSCIYILECDIVLIISYGSNIKVQDAGLLYCSPASGMSYLADGARAWRRCRGVAHGGRGAARSASAPYHAAVAGRPPYRWRGRAVSTKPPQTARRGRLAPPAALPMRRRVEDAAPYHVAVAARWCSRAVSICAEIIPWKYLIAWRKNGTDIAMRRENCYNVAHKEALYA